MRTPDIPELVTTSAPPSLNISWLGSSSLGLALVRYNSIYTISDIVHRRSRLYLEKSIRILTDPERYGGSVLYEWLLRTTRAEWSNESARLLADAPDALQAIQRLRQPWVCSFSSGACSVGRLTEAPQSRSSRNASQAVTVAPLSFDGGDDDLDNVTTLNFATFLRYNPAVQPLLQFEGLTCARVVEYAKVLRHRLANGLCAAAPAHTAAMHLRLGDHRGLLQPARPTSKPCTKGGRTLLCSRGDHLPSPLTASGPCTCARLPSCQRMGVPPRVRGAHSAAGGCLWLH